MKKILSILFIGILVVSLTGCGKAIKNSNTMDTNKDQQESKESVEITDVKAVSENYAVVVGDDNSTYIIDKEGNALGTITLTNDNVLINKDGYIAVKPEVGKVNIYDKTGKELYKTDDKTKFSFFVTESNLLLRRTIESSFSGNTSKTEIIDIDGNVKFETDIDAKLEYIGNDLVADITGNGVKVTINKVYDLKTNSEVDVSQYYSLKENNVHESWFLDLGVKDSNYTDWKYTNLKQNDILMINGGKSSGINNKNEYVVGDSYDVLLSNEYYYSGDKHSICKYDGTIVKDLSEGNGASIIGYYDNKYYIESGTGYYYVLDNNFNQILEPVELHVYNINKYGIMATDSNKSVTTLYDFELKNKKELSYKLKRDTPQYFIAEIENTDNSAKSYFNLNTQEKLVVYK